MNLYRILLCLPGCIGLWSCSQMDLSADGSSSKEEVTIHATQNTFSGNETRTVVGDVLSDGALVMKWAAGDQVGVFGPESANALFTSTNTTPEDNAGFKGQVNTGETLQYAYYPYAEGATDKTTVPVTIPAEQAYADETSVAQYDVKASQQIEQQTDGSYRMQMKQLATLVRFELNLADIKAQIAQTQSVADETIQSATLQAEASPLTGNYTCNLTDLDAGLKAKDAQSKTLTIRFTNAPGLSENTTLTAYAIVAPGIQRGQTLTCELQTDHYRLKLGTKVLLDFEAGKYYVVPLNASVFNNPDNTVTVEETTQPEEPEEETANCYMITTTGDHSFLATQIGNGNKGIIAGAGFHVTSAAISPVSAKLLWQDTEGFVSDIRLEADGRVHYTAHKNTGNAVIAVYDGADGTGNILWSWHIWGVGDTLPADEVITNQGGATFTVMDRNLGALSETSPTCTFYQWGRKDPVPGTPVYYRTDGTSADIKDTYPSYGMDNATILDGVQRPGELIYCPSNLPGDWLTKENDLLWGDNYVTTNPWFADGGYSNPKAGAGWTNQKTIYDPSPVGYRVAGKFTFTGFSKRTTGDTPQGNTTIKLKYINYVKYDNGWWFKKNENDTEGIRFHLSGSRAAKTGQLTEGEGYYWLSAATNLDYQSHYMYIGIYGTESTPSGYNSLNKLKTVEYSYRFNANAVRCVKEETNK